MRRSHRAPRILSSLSDSLHRQLNSYALAAGAAGVSLLALAQPSEAKVVYTKIHQVIGPNGIYALDFNHDGTIDLLIARASGSTGYGGSGSNVLYAQPALGNAVVGSKAHSASSYLASALNRGARIGPGRDFIPWGIMFSSRVRRGSSGGTFGKWKNVTKGFLGVKFKIHGKTYYGWARMNVRVSGYQIFSTLTGYAYETVPGKSIRGGQTEGRLHDLAANPESNNPNASAPAATVARTMPDAAQPASLGRLALGAQGVPIRRRP
jgi:hypothetical protein